MKKLFSILIILLLVGCGTTKEFVPVVQTKNVIIVPPDELLVKCDIKSPPPVSDYVASSWEDKEQLLVVYSSDLLKSLIKCNKTFDSLMEWKKKQVEIYSK
jgi:hypothetical protein